MISKKIILLFLLAATALGSGFIFHKTSLKGAPTETNLLYTIELQDLSKKKLTLQSYKNQLFMDVEVALAEAQSDIGIIPSWAAKEISSKANIKYLSQKDIDAEHKLVRHTLVARLNVWKRSIDKDASEYLHYGATTVDIWDTVLVLQIKDSIDLLIDE